MKITLTELRQMVRDVISEAKKKKSGPVHETEVRTDGHLRPEKAHDFSPPLGGLNPYRQQGQANFGPYTGDPTNVTNAAAGYAGDRPLYGSKLSESALRSAIRALVSEELRPDPRSAWAALSPPVTEVPAGIWESAMRYYDFQMRGLGTMPVHEEALPEEKVDEKHVGFKKMKNKLAHKKGVKDPGALAASIGRKKYGAKGMAKKAAAGRK